MPGVGFMVWVVGLGSKYPEFKSHSAVELILGGVNSACHPPEIGEMSTSVQLEEHSISGPAALQELIATWQPSCHTQEQKCPSPC